MIQVIPAIDLIGGKAVRLRQGKLNEKKIYSDKPLDLAKHFEQIGAEYLHLIDLDAAFNRGDNLKVIEKIISATGLKVEIGGGIRLREKAEHLIGSGADKVILGTKAFEDKVFLKSLLTDYPDKIVLGVDVKNGELLVKGWRETSDIDLASFLKDMEASGLRWIVYTDVLKDGTLEGVNYQAVSGLNNSLSLNIVASGGVKGIEDIEKLDSLGIWGVIVGKAFYEGSLDLKQAFSNFKGGK